MTESKVGIMGKNKRCLILRVQRKGTSAEIRSGGEDPKGEYLLRKYGGIAQLGEHLLCKQGVNGSNPFISTSGVSRKGVREQT